jgi:hypothetical protein
MFRFNSSESLRVLYFIDEIMRASGHTGQFSFSDHHDRKRHEFRRQLNGSLLIYQLPLLQSMYASKTEATSR